MKTRADEARSLTLLRQLRYLESELTDSSGSSDTHASNVDVEELLLASELLLTTTPANST